MDICLGIGGLAATAIVFAAVFGAFRRPVPAAWTRRPGREASAWAIVLLVGAASLGSLVHAAAAPAQAETVVTALGLGVTGSLVALALVAVPVLLRPALLQPRRRRLVPTDDRPAPGNGSLPA